MTSKDNGRSMAYKVFSIVVLLILAILFIFPLYWIITGALKTPAAINSAKPEWWPSEFTLRNFQVLFSKRSAPLFQFGSIIGPTGPAAIRWMIKRFIGRYMIFSLIVAAMALPKQVILIPLIREMSALGLYDNIWAVIFPTVGWPFGVFLMKQFSEGIPGEMLEAARIDGASELGTFTSIVVPMIKPGIGALAIFTFINSWNDYFMQLIMLTSSSNLTISLGIATMQAENSTDYGLIMAGAALAAVPIIIVFLIFQKYFTKGITMGAVKG